MTAVQEIPAALDPGAEASRLLRLQRDAFRRDGAPGLEERRRHLDALLGLVKGHRDALAAAISQDFGHRSPAETVFGELLVVAGAIRHTRGKLRAWMRPERRHVDLTFQPGRARVLYQPLGVIGIVSPWNYPLQLALAPLVDALAAGNRVLLKPSEFTPRTGELMQKLLGQVFPEERVAVVLGGPDVAAAFTRLPFDHLLFTGSTAVGRHVARAAAEQLTPVTLELGGKSPVILARDFPLERAARGIAQGKLFNAGQTCIAPDYVLAPRDQVEPFAQALLAAARRFYPKLAGNEDYSAIVSDRHYQRLAAMIEEAKAGGARVLTHDEAAAAGQRKLPLTVILDAKPGMKILEEEIFGPVLPVLPYDDIAGAVAHVNAGDRPLALYCYTHDRTLAEDVLARTISGGVTINGTLLHCAQDDLPFGGVGPSGQGAYHGHDGFKRFSHARAVYEVGPIAGFEWLAPPYGALFKFVSGLLMRR
jgi:coniferyl-aldehyde dehydrogenase